MKRTPPGQLEYRAPDCPICWTEVHSDGDGWTCGTCDAYWPYDDQNAEGNWLNEDVEQCGGIKQPFLNCKPEHENIRRNEYRCVLDIDHKGDHHADGHTYWKRQQLSVAQMERWPA